eukprot:8384277-Heterocapsa_arctica.AAC.1
MRPVLTGWDHIQQEGEEQEAPSEEINARRESDRFIADMAKRWLQTNACIWDGKEEICWCGAYDFLHHHPAKGANGEEPTAIRCSQQEEKTFWKRIRDDNER